MNHIKYARLSASGFLKQVFKFTETGRFVSRTFCILDVLYPGSSVNGRLVTGRFVTGRYVTGRFVGVPFLTRMEEYVLSSELVLPLTSGSELKDRDGCFIAGG